MDLHCKLFFERGGADVFSPNRAEILRSVERHGSLSKAAEELGMSYRWVWGCIKDTEKGLGIKLMAPSGIPGKGNVKELTPEAKELLIWFAAAEKEMLSALGNVLDIRPLFLRSLELPEAKRGKKMKISLD